MFSQLSMADEACLQRVLGLLLTSKSLRDQLAMQGFAALRQDSRVDITPGAWGALKEIAPRTCADLARALELNQGWRSGAGSVRRGPGHSDAA